MLRQRVGDTQICNVVRTNEARRLGAARGRRCAPEAAGGGALAEEPGQMGT